MKTILGAPLSRLVLLVILALALAACDRSQDNQGSPPPAVHDAAPLPLGLALQPTSALAIVAARKGLFRDAGLAVEIREYPSGKLALQGMQAGDCDLATAAAVPVMISVFDRRDFTVLASLANAHDANRIVARGDRGIEAPKDLRGKHLATQRGSALHFFLHLLLAKYGIDPGEMTRFWPELQLTVELSQPCCKTWKISPSG